MTISRFNTKANNSKGDSLPSFLRDGMSSRQALLKAILLLKFIQKESRVNDKQSHYLNVLSNNTDKKSILKENRKQAISEIRGLYEELSKQAKDIPGFESSMAQLVAQINEKIDIDAKTIRCMALNETKTYLRTVQKSIITSHSLKVATYTRLFKNFFKDSKKVGKIIGQSKEGVSRPDIIEYQKKHNTGEFFAKIPTVYEGGDAGKHPAGMLPYYEAIIGNIYGLYTDTPKSRVVEHKNQIHVLSEKIPGAVSLTDKSIEVPINNLFSSIILSIALRETDLKQANMITDFEKCYRIDFLHSLEGIGPDFNFNTLNLLDPTYLLHRLYHHSIPENLLAKTKENYDSVILEIINTVQRFVENQQESRVIAESKLGIQLSGLIKLSNQTLSLFNIPLPLPEKQSELTASQIDKIKSITPEAFLFAIERLQNDTEKKSLQAQAELFSDVDKLCDYITKNVNACKQGARQLILLWQSLGEDNTSRIQALKEIQNPLPRLRGP